MNDTPQKIEHLARLAMSLEAEDLIALGSFADQLSEVAPSTVAGTQRWEEINQLLEGLIQGSCPAPEESIERILLLLSEQQDSLEQSDWGTESGLTGVDVELLEMFVSGGEESLERLEDCLLGIEAGNVSSEIEQEVKRRLHTFKGEFGVLALNEAQEACHRVESVIEQAGSEAFPTAYLMQFVDGMRRYMISLGEGNMALPDGFMDDVDNFHANAERAPTAVEETDKVIEFPKEVFEDETLPEFLAEARAHLETVESSLLDMEDESDSSELLNRIFRAFHTIKGVAGFLNLEAVVRLAHSTETLLDEFRSGHREFEPDHLTIVLESCDFMQSLLAGLDGEVAPLERDLLYLVGIIDASSASELPSQRDEPRPTATQGPAIEESPTQTKDPVEQTPNRANATRQQTTVRVCTNRLDSLVDMVGELVIAQQMIHQSPELENLESEMLNRRLGEVAKITRDLQESTMSLRMVTLKSTFQKMARLVRDVSAKAGRRVKLVRSGEDTELDRNVVEEISDPLVHLIRNAVDHGIEPPEERTALGKDPQGRIELKAYHQGGSIVIDICDDGRGLDRERILAKAVERGLLPPETTKEDLSEDEVFSLIFQPGFSTAQTVSDISGRGVGMDVVRKNIEELRGKVEIHSTQGKGSVLTLRLPLTLAIIDGMVVLAGGRRFVIPTLAIVQSFRPTPEQLHSTLGGGELVSVRGSLVPVHRMSDMLDDGRPWEPADGNGGVLILLESGSERASFLVDELLGQQQVVIKSIGDYLPDMVAVSGGAILGDGRVAPIIDVDGLLSHARGLSLGH